MKCINELHPLYLSLQYQLIFPYVEDGYKVDISHCKSIEKLSRKICKLKMREIFSCILKDKLNDFLILMNTRRVL